MAHLDERVDHTDIGAGIEDLVEPRLSVDQLQLVELLVVLWEKKQQHFTEDETLNIHGSESRFEEFQDSPPASSPDLLFR